MKKLLKGILPIFIIVMLIMSAGMTASAGSKYDYKNTDYGKFEAEFSISRGPSYPGQPQVCGYYIQTYIPQNVNLHFNKFMVKYNSTGNDWQGTEFKNSNCKQGGSTLLPAFTNIPSQTMAGFSTQEIRHTKSYVIYQSTTC